VCGRESDSPPVAGCDSWLGRLGRAWVWCAVDRDCRAAGLMGEAVGRAAAICVLAAGCSGRVGPPSLRGRWSVGGGGPALAEGAGRPEAAADRR
jgi:hypothetical protein